MPVATRDSTIHDVSHGLSILHMRDDEEREERINCNDVPRVAPALSLFWEIIDLRNKIEQYQKEETEAKKCIEPLVRCIEQAQEILDKAEKKKQDLVERNLTLETRLHDLDQRIAKSLKYWGKYGLEVRQVSTADDPFEQYEFTFTNLKRKSHKSVSSLPDEPPAAQDDNNQTPTNGQKQVTCSIHLRYQDKKLEIVDQVPLVLSIEEVTQLNDKLTHQCVNQNDGKVNYKSAMTLLGKDLKRNLYPSPKTCSHPPAETSIRTCT